MVGKNPHDDKDIAIAINALSNNDGYNSFFCYAGVQQASVGAQRIATHRSMGYARNLRLLVEPLIVIVCMNHSHGNNAIGINALCNGRG
jgi:hypothetical protein